MANLKYFLLLIFLFQFHGHGQELCSELLNEPQFKLIFPKGVEPVSPSQSKGHIQIGFESEYTAADSEELWKVFMPDESITGLNKSQWLDLSHQEKIAIVKDKSDSIFPNYRENGKLTKITDDEELAKALPDSFLYDSGNFEIVLPPSDRVGEISHKIKTINKGIGIGSMQVTSSVPRQSFFQFNGKVGAEFFDSNISQDVIDQSIKANVGYFNVVNDIDTFSKMASGYKRYVDSPSSLTAQSFAHPWLGPMNTERHLKLKNLLDEMGSGRKISEDEVSEIATIIDSHKFIGGAVFRPDVARKQNRMAIEIRNCHKNPLCLEEELKRDVYFYQKGKEVFKEAADLTQFNRSQAWSQLDTDIQITLKELFPKYGNYNADHTAVYLNFSFPYRDWSSHVKLYGDESLHESIKNAQDIYKNRLKEIVNARKGGALTDGQAKADIQGALNKFIIDSGLYESSQKYYKGLLDESFDELDFIKLSQFMMREVLYV